MDLFPLKTGKWQLYIDGISIIVYFFDKHIIKLVLE